MQYLKKGLLFASALLMMTSCGMDTPWGDSKGEGSIRVSLTTDNSVYIGAGTRADGKPEKLSDVPQPADFNIFRIEGSGGSMEFSEISKLHDAEFKEGNYTVSAHYYGDENKNITGFGCPYFKAEESVQVLSNQTANVNLTAKLANSIITVSFSDLFKQEYKEGYEVTFISKLRQNELTFTKEGLEGTEYKGTEYMGYIESGEVDATLRLTRNGNIFETTVPEFPYNFEPQSKYNVTFDIDPSAKFVIFNITKNNALIESKVDVEGLFSSKLLNITPNGFENNQTFEIVKGESLGNLTMLVNALNGIQEAEFKVVNGTLEEYKLDLLNATEDDQRKLSENGVNARGFYRNPDKMAQLDITGLIKNLKEGVNHISLSVKDKSNPDVAQVVQLTVNVQPLNINATPELSIEDPTTLYVDLKSNVELTTDNLSFNVKDGTEELYDGPASKLSDVAVTRAVGDFNKRAELRLKKASDNLTVTVRYNQTGGSWNDATEIELSGKTNYFPNYEIEADAYAHKVLLRITSDSPENTQKYVKKLLIDGYNVSSRNEENNIITVTGFNAGTSNNLTLHLENGLNAKTVTFDTEKENQITNGNFDNTNETIKINPINAGGQYKYGATKMQNVSSILVNEPVGWATINQKTCYTGSNPANTWFMVPSTFVTDGKVTVRSVAYDHKGTLPEQDNHGLDVKLKFSRNAPTSFANRVAGELFLGEYTFNGTEKRVEGVAFASRPSELTFDYTYTPVGNETGLVEICLFSNGEKIKTVTADITSGQGSKTVQIGNYAFGKKADKLYVRFLSAKGDNVAAPVPTDLADVTNKTSLDGQTISTNKYKSLCVGSVLTIDNVKLGYDGTPNESTRAKKYNKKRGGRR